MSFQPYNWNVIVAGAWNRAILTPDWIGRYLFQAPGTPLAVEVPLNVPGPWRVRHDALAVLSGQGILEVVAETHSYQVLDQARNCAKHAMGELPRTPLAAAGFNIRYKSNELPPDFAPILACSLDDIISRNTMVISKRSSYRSLVYKEGLLNLRLDVGTDGTTSIEFNFHKDSTTQVELESWLSVPISEIQNQVETILNALPGVIYEPGQ